MPLWPALVRFLRSLAGPTGSAGSAGRRPRGRTRFRVRTFIGHSGNSISSKPQIVPPLSIPDSGKENQYPEQIVSRQAPRLQSMLGMGKGNAGESTMRNSAGTKRNPGKPLEFAGVKLPALRAPLERLPCFLQHGDGDVALLHHLARDFEFLHLLLAGQMVHQVEHELFQDHAQSARAHLA